MHLTGIHDTGGSRIRFGIEHTPGIGQYGMVASDLDVSNGEWNHVVITRDASSGEFVMYLNGSYVESHSDNLEGESDPSELSGEITIYGPLQMGAWNDSGRGAFPGSISETIIWNRVLSESEIMSIDQLDLNGNESDLIAYWNFNEGEGTTLTDLSGNGNDGTIHGSSWESENHTLTFSITG